MKKEKYINHIDINARFGSKFQEEIALKSLYAFLNIWRDFYEAKNKKTDVSWVIGKSESL